jgi:hypothetical protein
MEKQFDNSIASFSRRVSIYPAAIVSAVVLLCLSAGFVAAVAWGSLTFAAIFVAVAIGLAIFAYLDFAEKRRLSAAEDRKRIDWETANPEIQRQNLKLEVFELARVLDVESDQMSDLQSAFIVAQDLALRQIQQEENVPLMWHVSVGNIPFDAILVKNEVIACLEVSFLVEPDLRQDKIDAMMRKISAVKKAVAEMNIGMRTRLMMVLVTQLTPEDDERLRAVLNTRRFSTTPVDIDIRLLDFEALQRIYVTD